MRPEPIANLMNELSPEERAALGDLAPLAERLDGYIAPEPSPADTARLLQRLRPMVAARAEILLPEPEPASAGARYFLRLAWSQTTLMEPAFWWASGLIFLLGIIMGLLDRAGSAAVLYALAAPVLAAAGVAYAFRPSAGSLLELERSMPIQPLELIYSRLGLVASFNLAVTLGALLVLWVQEPQTVLWRLVATWLGPLLAMTGIALYATVRWGTIAGAAAPLALWLALLGPLFRFDFRQVSTPWWELIPTLAQSNLALGLSLALLGVGLLFIRLAGRHAQREGSAWS